MFNITLKRPVAALAVVAGLLVSAGPAGAIVYNGHAGLGSNVYQHNQTDLEYTSAAGTASRVGAGIVDGTSNTVMIGLLAPPHA